MATATGVRSERPGNTSVIDSNNKVLVDCPTNLANALLENQELLAELFVMHPELREGLDPHWSTRNRYLLRSRLFLIPLNPNHKLNSVLLNHFHFPFVKVDLVTKNQGLVPSAPDWRYFLTSDSPVTEAMIDDHLAAL